MVKKALLIGINYAAGAVDELFGCHNDVEMTLDYLIEQFGFKDENIDILMDDEYADSKMQPTGENIRKSLKKLIEFAKPGDILFVHFSGHGTRFPSESGQEDDTGFDECIVPSDYNYIFDKEFKELMNKVPEDCSFTFVSDCCRSGGLIDSLKEQIGDSHKKKPKGSTNKVLVKDQDNENKANARSRVLPLESAIDKLKQQTGRDDIKVGNIRMALYDVFGEHASPQVKKFMKVIYTNLLEKINGEGSHCERMHFVRSTCEDSHCTVEEMTVEDCNEDEDDLTLENFDELETDTLEEKLDDEEYWKPAMEVEVKNKKEVYARESDGEVVENVILLSGCQTDQTSDDTGFTKETSHGAFTKAISTILVVTDGKISNEDLVNKSRKLMVKEKRKQRPGLYCIDEYVDAQFIC